MPVVADDSDSGGKTGKYEWTSCDWSGPKLGLQGSVLLLLRPNVLGIRSPAVQPPFAERLEPSLSARFRRSFSGAAELPKLIPRCFRELLPFSKRAPNSDASATLLELVLRDMLRPETPKKEKASFTFRLELVLERTLGRSGESGNAVEVIVGDGDCAQAGALLDLSDVPSGRFQDIR